MEKFEITKDDIIKLSAFGGNTEATLKQWFPDAFKTELEVGKWYKANSTLVFIDDLEKETYYGFFGKNWGKWSFSNGSNKDVAKPATHQEVETALITEAKKRGFKNGNYKCLDLPKWTEKKVDNNFYLEENKLWMGDFGCANLVFKDGKWATIISQKLTLEERVANLEKKLSCNQE